MVTEALFFLSLGLALTLGAFAVLWPRVARNAVARAWHHLWWIDVSETKSVTPREMEEVGAITSDEIFDHCDMVEFGECFGKFTAGFHGRRARKWWRWMWRR